MHANINAVHDPFDTLFGLAPRKRGSQCTEIPAFKAAVVLTRHPLRRLFSNYARVRSHHLAMNGIKKQINNTRLKEKN